MDSGSDDPFVDPTDQQRSSGSGSNDELLVARNARLSLTNDALVVTGSFIAHTRHIAAQILINL